MDYPVTLCLQPGCGHPGGQHIIGITGSGACRLCECPGWDTTKTEPGRWSNEKQRAAERRQETTPS